MVDNCQRLLAWRTTNPGLGKRFKERLRAGLGLGTGEEAQA